MFLSSVSENAMDLNPCQSPTQQGIEPWRGRAAGSGGDSVLLPAYIVRDTIALGVWAEDATQWG